MLAGAGVVAASSALAAGAWVLPQAGRAGFVREVRRRARAARALVLTYDDGPGDRMTPRVLDALGAAGGAKATFFVLGRAVAGRAAVMDRIVGEGHEVGCHGWGHLNGWRNWPWRVAGDVESGYEAAARWMAGDGAFRPPYGKLSLAGWGVLRRRGARAMWWTVDSGDTQARMPEPGAVAEAVARAGGGVVLLHDFDRAEADGARERFVLETTGLLLATAAREGMAVMRLDELMDARGGGKGGVVR